VNREIVRALFADAVRLIAAGALGALSAIAANWWGH
jgi:hypothetical protein